MLKKNEKVALSAAFFSAVSADFHPMNLIITLKRKNCGKAYSM